MTHKYGRQDPIFYLDEWGEIHDGKVLGLGNFDGDEYTYEIFHTGIMTSQNRVPESQIFDNPKDAVSAALDYISYLDVKVAQFKERYGIS